MPIQVAQLQILVEAPTGPAIQGLQAITQAYSQAAQASVAAAAQQVGGDNQVIQAIQAQTAAVVSGTEQQMAALNGLGESVDSMAGKVRSGSSTASSSLQGVNTVLAVTGQAGGPVAQSLMVANAALNTLDTTASTSEKILTGLAGAITGVGLVAAGIAGPMEQASNVLNQSLQNTGHDTDEYAQAVQRAETQGEAYATTIKNTDQALALLNNVTATATQLTDAYAAAQDLAAGANISLSNAVKIVDSAIEGNGRSLRRYGVDIEGLVLDPTQKAATALERLTTAQGNLANAQASLSASQQRYSDTMAEDALKVDGVAKATLGLTRALEDQQTVIDKISAENLAPTRSHEADATDKVTDAQQKLNDVMEKQTVAALQPQIDAVADSTDKLTIAQLHLQEVMAAKTTASITSPEEMLKLADASEKVLNAQLALAHAQGGDIAGAQNQLRAAIDSQRASLDAQAKKYEEANRTTSEQVSAQVAVKNATRDLQNAQQVAYLQSIGQTPKQVQDAIDLRDAIQNVAKAQNDLVTAKQQDVSDNAVKAITQATQLRDATRSVADAQAGVVQAHRDAQAEALRERDAVLQVQAAQRSVATEAKKVADLQAAYNAATLEASTQTQKVLDAVNKQFGGDAKAKADNWWGRFKADATTAYDDVGKVGGAIAGIATSALPVVLVGKLIKGFFSKGGGGDSIPDAIAADTAPAIDGLAGGAEVAGVGVAAGLGPGVAAIAALGTTAVGAWYILHDDTHRKEALAAIVGDLKAMKGDAESVWNGFTSTASTAWDAVGNVFSDHHKIVASLDDAGGWLKLAGKATVDGYRTGVGDELNTDVPWYDNPKLSTLRQFEDAATLLEESGRDVARGLGNGFTEEMQWQITNQIKPAIQNIEAGVRSVLRSSSPSRVFHDIGTDVVQGLVNGIAQDMNKPIDAVQSMATKLTQVPLGASSLGYNGSAGAIGQGAVIIQVAVTVQGSVATQNDIVRGVADGLINLGFGQGGNLGAGYIGAKR